jgi:hypothetical protein
VHTAKWGVAGRLAYKLDTLIINRRIEAAGCPVPNVIPIGSLREIAEERANGFERQLATNRKKLKPRYPTRTSCVFCSNDAEQPLWRYAT